MGVQIQRMGVQIQRMGAQIQRMGVRSLSFGSLSFETRTAYLRMETQNQGRKSRRHGT
jgi:hypothetical protein